MSLVPGSVLSYSAGSSSSDPYSFRVVRQGESPLLALSRCAPGLIEWLFARTPVFVNAYPAVVSPPPGVVFADSYLSTATCSRALSLAAREETAAVLVAQPLMAARVMNDHLRQDRGLPRRLLLVLGGYSVPRSLMAALDSWTPEQCELRVLELYGMAEVDAACLVSRPGPAPQVWVPRGDIEWHIGPSGILHLRRNDQAAFFCTGDRAVVTSDGLIIESTRVDALVRRELDDFTGEDWRWRSGYRVGGRWVVREGSSPRSSSEIKAAVDWTTKPSWSS